MSRRNYVSEILSKKQRTVPTSRRWDLVSNRINDMSVIPHVIRLIENLQQFSLSTIEELEGYEWIRRDSGKVIDSSGITWEIARYIPIGLVGCIEGYFRKVYVDLIDHGSPYKENAAKLTDIKFSLETAISLEIHSISIGEFIAHLITTNNLEDINKNISTLIGDDFLEQLKTARKSAIPHSYELPLTENNIYCVEPDYDDLNSDMIMSIKRMFELRHMFCHEIDPTMSSKDYSSILGYPETAIEFLWISEFVIDKLLS